jgi:hypothetical protein
MKHRLRLLAALVMLGSLTGCSGDSFGSLFHETLAIYNELADNMVFICDEESAGRFMGLPKEKLDKRWHALTQRVQDYLKRLDADANPKIKFDIINQFVDHVDEFLAVQIRLKEQFVRIDDIRYKIYKERYGHLGKKGEVADLERECPELTKVLAISKALDLSAVLQDNPFDAEAAKSKGNMGAPQPGVPGAPGAPGMGPGGPGPIGPPGGGPVPPMPMGP